MHLIVSYFPQLYKVNLHLISVITRFPQRGDTALHIAIRARSKRITELLLRNPRNSRLLYRPNKDGETPYAMDTYHQRGILQGIYGHREFEFALHHSYYMIVVMLKGEILLLIRSASELQHNDSNTEKRNTNTKTGHLWCAKPIEVHGIWLAVNFMWWKELNGLQHP